MALRPRLATGLPCRCQTPVERPLFFTPPIGPKGATTQRGEWCWTNVLAVRMRAESVRQARKDSSDEGNIAPAAYHRRAILYRAAPAAPRRDSSDNSQPTGDPRVQASATVAHRSIVAPRYRLARPGYQPVDHADRERNRSPRPLEECQRSVALRPVPRAPLAVCRRHVTRERVLACSVRSDHGYPARSHATRHVRVR